MMNVFSDDLVHFKTITIKGCMEVQFANGGHLFAAIQTNTIAIYNFWTGETDINHNFPGHSQKVRCINWYDDDSGFTSTG
jgi:hypothetical protein